jgi:hypothetical protein
MRTGGADGPFFHDRHFSAASSFQIGVSRGRRSRRAGPVISQPTTNRLAMPNAQGQPLLLAVSLAILENQRSLLLAATNYL